MRTISTSIFLTLLAMAGAYSFPDDFRPPLKCDALSWVGSWETNWGTMNLAFNDDEKIVGSYSASEHSVEGCLDHNDASVFVGRWKHTGSNSTGKFRFRMTGPNSFAGTWTWNDDDPSKGGWTWTGTRGEANELSAQPSGKAKPSGKLADGGQQWTQKIRLKNNTGKDFFIYGYSREMPFFNYQLKDPESGKWIPHHQLYCGTGAGMHQIESGTEFPATSTCRTTRRVMRSRSR